MQAYISLYDLNRKIREGYQQMFPASLWIVAEISEIRQNYNGHVYLELIEKDPSGKQILARSKATIWAGNWRSIKPYFELNTGLELKSEQKVLVQVSVSFHELYGHSLNIVGIDPNYTLGDQARKRKEIIDRLIQEGVFEMNKEMPFPDLPQRIAIVSSATAAGYSDFMNHLFNNQKLFRFQTRLFQSIMQGDQAIDSILRSLDMIFDEAESFDLVVIIRGGGSKAELSTFDNYDLAANIAQFPLPVLTGIGHERDESIADLVAYHAFKTPTAVADYLIGIYEEHARYLDELKEEVMQQANQILQNNHRILQRFSDRFIPTTRRILQNHQQGLLISRERLKGATQNFIRKDKTQLIQYQTKLLHQIKFFNTIQHLFLTKSSDKLKQQVSNFLQPKKMELKHFAQHVNLVKPENVLKKGYSLVYQEGKIIKKAGNLKAGERIETRFIDGSVISISEKIQLNPETD